MLAARPGASPWTANRETVQEYERIKAALNAEARDRWAEESFHREVAATLQSTIDYQFTFDSLFGTYFQVQRVGEFEKLYVRERRGLKVFYTHRGGYIEESQLKTEDWELPRDTLGFHVSEFSDKLRANFADTIESLVGLAQERMDAEVNRRMFNLLQEAVPSSSPFYVNAAGSGLTKPVLDTALREVRDAIKPNGQGPVPVTIIGRAAGVDQISDLFTDGFMPEANEEIRTRGRLGVYRGANIVQVVNYTDENGMSYIPEDEVWVMGGTVGLFAMYGELQTKSWEENTVDYRHYRGRKDIGGLVHHPEQARRIKIA
jgi:hypothetical protein